MKVNGKNFFVALCTACLLCAASDVRAQWPPQPVRSAGRGTTVVDATWAGPDLRLFEFELGGGLSLAPKWKGMKGRPGGKLLLELRLNRPEPWDIALQLMGSKFFHDPGGNDRSLKTDIMSPSLFVDYNWRPSTFTRYFVGLGVGGTFATNNFTMNINQSSGVMLRGSEDAFAVTPRVGMSVLNGLRLTAEYVITKREYSRFGLTLGLTIGGSYRRAGPVRRGAPEPGMWESVVAPVVNSIIESRR